MKMLSCIRLVLALSLFLPLAATAEIPIRQSTPLQGGGKGLGTAGYLPLKDETDFIKKITEKPVNLWGNIKVPKPENVSDDEWKKREEERIAEEKKQISVDDYELNKQAGEYAGWFGIVRSIDYDASKNQTRLLIEHKYFDGLTDLHIHIVSIYGAGDFEVILPGKLQENQIPKLGLICVYGKVTKGDKDLASLQAEYVRVWNWGFFTFMDYGKDKSNPKWVKLRKNKEDDAYSPNPNKAYYEERIGVK